MLFDRNVFCQTEQKCACHVQCCPDILMSFYIVELARFQLNLFSLNTIILYFPIIKF